MTRQVSLFAVTGRASEAEEGDLPFDEKKMERAMAMLGNEAENINEDDPRQAANLMRKLSDMTGMELGPGMREALRRMEQGEDPDRIEAEMGSLLEGEDPFILPDVKGKGGRQGGTGRQRMRPSMIWNRRRRTHKPTTQEQNYGTCYSGSD